MVSRPEDGWQYHCRSTSQGCSPLNSLKNDPIADSERSRLISHRRYQQVLRGMLAADASAETPFGAFASGFEGIERKFALDRHGPSYPALSLSAHATRN